MPGKDPKDLRYGYTTGTCAAAAAKACCRMICKGERVDAVSITTPSEKTLLLDVCNQSFTGPSASCCIVKDGGDDPDATHGMKICAKVYVTETPGTKVVGGDGIGTVTKPGLSVDVGAPAINPVPMGMIRGAVSDELGEDAGAVVEIYAPDGSRVAEQTMNKALGIQGGISIIGTTGIVVPMSERALKASLSLHLSVIRAQGATRAVLVPGNYGMRFLTETLMISEDTAAKTSNYVGFMLDEARRLGYSELLLVGHIGKLAKVAAGVFNTHSSVADCRMETIAAHAATCGATRDTVRDIMGSNTTEEAVGILLKTGGKEALQSIAAGVSRRCEKRCKGEIKIGTVLFSLQHGMLSTCDEAKRMLQKYTREVR